MRRFLILLGVALTGFAGGYTSMAIKALICATFVLVTSPVAAHAVCRGAYISGVPLWGGSVEDQFARRAQEIIALNRIEDPDMIQPGMQLKIPKQ